jgi:hypothetical protein
MWRGFYNLRRHARDAGRAIAGRCALVGSYATEFLLLRRVVHIRAEGSLYGVTIPKRAVCRELHAMLFCQGAIRINELNAGRDIAEELIRDIAHARRDEVRHHQL